MKCFWQSGHSPGQKNGHGGRLSRLNWWILGSSLHYIIRFHSTSLHTPSGTVSESAGDGPIRGLSSLDGLAATDGPALRVQHQVLWMSFGPKSQSTFTSKTIRKGGTWTLWAAPFTRAINKSHGKLREQWKHYFGQELSRLSDHCSTRSVAAVYF